MSKPIIELRDYSYRYSSEEDLVLKHVTFTINEGDFVGVVGCNRAGKSTLCKSIVGIVPFVFGGDWDGEILVDGKSMNETRGKGVMDVVGIVFQDAESQFTQQTVEDEIAFAMCNFGYDRALMRERIQFAAEVFQPAVDLVGAPPLGTLEEGVFGEVRQPVLRFQLVARACTHDERAVGHVAVYLAVDAADTVGKRIGMEFLHGFYSLVRSFRNCPV